MPVYESFKKDWDLTKTEMEKVGGKKPAEVKRFGVWFVKFEKRVSSGIGDALKDLDKSEPEDPKNPTVKELGKFRDAVIELRKAIKTEVELIEGEVDKYRGEDGKVDQDRKDGYYRVLKVFKAKLAHYEAAATQQLLEYQQEIDQRLDEGDKKVNTFQVDTKQRLTKAALALKEILVAPTAESYLAGIEDIKRAFVQNRTDSAMMAGWFSTKRDKGDFKEGTFDTLYRDFTNANTVDRRSTPEEVKTAASAIGNLIKQSIEALAGVKTPKS